MVSKQTVRVVIEAEEQVSKVAKKAEQALSKMGNIGKKGMNAINSVSSKVQSTISKVANYVEKARNKFNELRNSGQSAGSIIRQGISNAANSVGKLITNSNTAKLAMEKIKSAAGSVKSSFDDLKNKIVSFGSSAKSSLTSAFSFTNIKSKLSQVGSSIDQLKVKLRELGNQAKNTGSGFGFLKNALSMTVGMIGYDLVNGFIEAGRAAINAQGQLDYFAKRLNMSASTTASFNSYLGDLQTQFRKVDMKAVGASAEEMAVKLNLPISSLRELTQVTAVMSSAFVKEGRSQTDAILAVSDALDGQFKRLQELGITQEMLKNNGWSGDISDKTSLLKAMNKTLDEMGFTDTAKDITSLDEAFQALSVAGGSLLASILIPITPALVDIAMAIMSAMDGIKGFIGMIQSAFGALPDWAKYAVGITVLAVGIGLVVAAAGGLVPVLVSLIGPLYSVAMAAMAIEWPLVAVVAAIALVVAAIYEIGKAFGWWSDVGSMLEAISAGLQRMWSAFINHPDVQAAISAIGNALKILSQWIGQAINAVMQFFGISSGSNWDVTRAIIDAIGVAWSVMSVKIKIAIAILQTAWNILSWLVSSAVAIGQAIYNALKPIVCILLGCSPGIVPALKIVLDVFTSVWNTIAGFVGNVISSIVDCVQPLIDVFEDFRNGQASLGDLVVTIVSTIFNVYVTLYTQLATLIITLASNMLTWAIQAGSNFLNGISTYFSQVASNVSNYLNNAKLIIMAQLLAWVTLAKTRASQFVTGIITFVSTLPGKVMSHLSKTLSNIISAGSQWVSSAKQKASELVSGAVNTLASLPGKIASTLSGVVEAVVKPFRDAYNQAKAYWDNITSLGGLFSGFDVAAGGFDVTTNQEFNINTGSFNVNNEPIEVNVNERLVLDLVNVPAHIDTDTLIRMLNDPEVLRAFTSNPDFQEMDRKIKLEISNRYNRARGV